MVLVVVLLALILGYSAYNSRKARDAYGLVNAAMLTRIKVAKQ